MNILLPNNSRMTYEELFEQVTEDISTYLWAMEAWPEDSEGFSPDYLLIQALSHRARGRMGLSLIPQILSGEYYPYREKLEQLWHQAESLLQKKIREHCDMMENQVADQFIVRLTDLKDTLNKIRRFSQDGLLIGDSEWVKDEVREEAHEYLMVFQEMNLAKEELEKEPFRTAFAPQKIAFFHQQMTALEKDFRRFFYYFRPIVDLLPAMQLGEYGTARWWFLPPSEEKVLPEAEEAVMTALVESLGRTFRATAALTPADCPRSELAISYATGDLPFDQRGEVQQHLLTCRCCLDLVMDLCQSELTAKARAGQRPEVLLKLKQAILPPLATVLSNVIDKVDDLVKEWVEVLELFWIRPLRPALVRTSTPQEVKVESGKTYQTRGRFKLKFGLTRDAFVALLWQDSFGSINRLYTGMTIGGEIQELLLPGEALWRLSGDQGQETFFLMTFPSPIPNLDQRLTSPEVKSIDDLKAAFPEAEISLLKFVHKKLDTD